MKKLTYQILKECVEEIIQAIGYGLAEKVYQNALDIALKKRNFNVEQEVEINIIYENQLVGKIRADTIVNDNVIIELKAIYKITEKERAQLRRYLRFTGIKNGFLVNFSYYSYSIEIHNDK